MECSESAKQSYDEISESERYVVALHHGAHLNHKRGQSSKSTAEANRKQEPIVISYDATFSEPRNTGQHLHDNAHDKTTQ